MNTEKILVRALGQEKLTGEELIHLLQTREEEKVTALFKTARELRSEFFGNKIFIYGFLYISTYCRNNCRFCFYRAGNKNSLRYRKKEEEVVEAALRLAESGIHLLDLTMAEDPYYLNQEDDGYERLIRLVERVKREIDLPLMVSPGVVPEQVLAELAGVGANWYACYQETHNPSLFKELRPGQSYEKRLNTKHLAHKYGLLCEEGILAGVGESPEDVAESVKTMAAIKADQVRAMNFIPREGTPMKDFFIADPLRELVYTAVMRLAFPGRLIPASLDVDGLAGLKKRLAAGANVVTSLILPGWGLAGVARSYLDIGDNKRSISGVLPVLEECGLRAAASSDYRSWISKRREAYRVS